MIDQPTGRALAEAAARAMGWHFAPVVRMWVDSEGVGRFYEEEELKLTEREMLAWLHGFGEHGSEVYTTSRTDDYVCELSKGIMRGGTVFYLPHEKVNGTTLREVLMLMVVAVAEREATNG